MASRTFTPQPARIQTPGKKYKQKLAFIPNLPTSTRSIYSSGMISIRKITYKRPKVILQNQNEARESVQSKMIKIKAKRAENFLKIKKVEGSKLKFQSYLKIPQKQHKYHKNIPKLKALVAPKRRPVSISSRFIKSKNIYQKRINHFNIKKCSSPRCRKEQNIEQNNVLSP